MDRLISEKRSFVFERESEILFHIFVALFKYISNKVHSYVFIGMYSNVFKCIQTFLRCGNYESLVG